MAAVRARAQQIAQQVHKTLVPLYEKSEKQAVDRYKKLMSENQQYVVKDPAAADKLLKQYVFTSLSRIPTLIENSQKDADNLKGKFSKTDDVKFNEVLMYGAFVGELYAWFCLGEIVGRGFTLTGYSI